MYYPEGMKAQVSPVQSIEPHRILAPTRDSNQELPGPQSRVVTTILPLHTDEGFQKVWVQRLELAHSHSRVSVIIIITIYFKSIKFNLN